MAVILSERRELKKTKQDKTATFRVFIHKTLRQEGSGGNTQ